MADRFEDHRGVIQDILQGPIDCVTEIQTRAGAVRGNHAHFKTVQYTYVVSGVLRAAWIDDDGPHEKVHGPGALITEPAGVYHAWKAESDCTVLVFTKGPRSGEAYETDTTRLERPILT